MGCQYFKQLVLAFSIAALLIFPSINGVTYQTLYTICSQTQNEETCVKILQTDPSTNSSTLPQLSLISINLTRDQANKNYKIFTDLRDNTTSSSLKAAYGDCATIYLQMLYEINDAYLLALQQRYKDIHQLGQVLYLAYKCENGLPSSSPTASCTETMVLTSEASSSVILYLASIP